MGLLKGRGRPGPKVIDMAVLLGVSVDEFHQVYEMGIGVDFNPSERFYLWISIMDDYGIG